jgi:hypothetical protein
MPTHADFSPFTLLASAFTPERGLSPALVLSRFLPQFADIFNGEPVLFPAVPGLPREVVTATLTSNSGAWVCEVSGARLNIVWRLVQEARPPTLPDFLAQAIRMIHAYQGLGVRIGRLAMVVNRLAQQDTPGRWLAEHFCAPHWLAGPVGNARFVEFHVHKIVEIRGPFRVNTWVRSRAALTDQQPPLEVILVEQDINTLLEQEAATTFTPAQVADFFEAAQAEMQTQLEQYYPR